MRYLVKRDFFRHGALLASTVTPYLSSFKLGNLIRCEWEWLGRVTRPQSFPYMAILDITNACNLRCPFCPTGARRDSGRRQRFLPVDLVRKLLAEVGSYLISAVLFNWGEPLLHPQLPEIVRLFHQNRIFTSVSSNLNIAPPDVFAALCEAGLDHLVISVSGASQEVYEKYHRKGQLQLLLDNLKFVTDYKRRHHLSNPVIEIKYLVFSFNRHEVEAAAHLTKCLGADLFLRVAGGGSPEVEVSPANKCPRINPFLASPPCHQLWQTVVLNTNGGVAPCCYTYFQAQDLGNFSQGTLRKIRLNEKFTNARSLFNLRRFRDLPPHLQHPCLQCHLVHAQPHLQRYLDQNPHAVQGYRTGGP